MESYAAVARSATQAAPIATQTTSATAAATAATEARAATQPEPLAAPDTARAKPGTVYESHPPSDGNGHGPVSGRLYRLRIGSHTVSRAALTQLGISSPGMGLVLGADRHQRPVSVRFFRPEPTRIAVVGGAWAGQLISFRALALGTRVAVVTAEPGAWDGFGERATGRGDRVGVLTAEQRFALNATAHQPFLIIYDLGLTGPTVPPPLGPWQTQLVILRQLDQSGVPSIQDCHLVMLQRLGDAEANVAGTALRVPDHSVGFLRVMANDMAALIGGGADRYVWFAQTDVERRYTGEPRR